MKILVGSKNPVKINAVKTAYERYFGNVETIGMEVDSKVSSQPINDDTFKGAKNRSAELKKINDTNNLNADYFVGIEGGIIKLFSTWFAFGCMCVMDKEGNTGFGTSPMFELPESIIRQLLSGKELGLIMDELQNQSNTKQKHGAIGYFTNGVMDRHNLYVQGLITAIIPFLHKEMFLGEES